MMKNTKRILTIFLLIALVLTSALSVNVLAAEKTSQEKAEALNTVKVLTGVNGEYNLSSQLRRSEAVTFIVRLIGKADYVIQHKAQYSLTPFSDVPSNQWYAPYIGYSVENGIISTGSKEFKPNDYISDKDFIKLVLSALDYREGVDFTSDNVFDKAREIGLTTLTYYVNHINRDIITTRESAVNILYTALSLKVRTGEKILCQKLKDEGVVTRRQLTSLGFIEDTIVTNILEINTLDLNKLEIKLNENITFASGVKIYPKDNALAALNCSIELISGDTLIIKTETMDEKTEYTLELTGVWDEKENVVDKLLKNFKGFESREVNSDFFRIRKIEPVNGRSLKVYFTQPISINSEICLYYSILKGDTVIADGKQGHINASLISAEDNAVLLTLNNGALTADTLYTLNIEGSMMSGYGVRMNNGLGDSMKFVAVDKGASKFELKQITAVDKKTIFLKFSKEVNTFLAEQVFNFYLTDEGNTPIRIVSTAVDPIRTGVYLSLEKEMTKDKKYILTINNINDATKQEYITEERFSFKAEYGTTDSTIINKINVIDSQTIEFTFSKPLNEAAAIKLSNYTINRWGVYSGISPDKVLYDPASNRVKLFLSKNNSLSGQNDYEIKLDSSMKDYLGNSINTSGIRFSGSSKQREDIAIESIAPLSTDAVKVTFTKEIAFTASNLVPSNYTLEYMYDRFTIKKVPIRILYVNEKTLVLKFDVLEYDLSYKLKIAELLDYTGNITKGREKVFELGK